MRKIKNILLINFVLFSVFSCKSSKNDPYSVKYLNNLKSQEDALIAKDFNKSYYLYANNEYLRIYLTFDKDKKDIQVSKIAFYYEERFNEILENDVRIFFNTYFFLTNEKFEKLFPADYVESSLKPLTYSTINIKLYENANAKNNNFQLFTYTYEYDGFLILKSYNGLISGETNLKF